MTAVFSEEGQTVGDGEILTIRVYATIAAKRAVVVKDGDLLTKKEMKEHHREVSSATTTEILTWFDNTCFENVFLKWAKNIMTSRYVAKWTCDKGEDGMWQNIIRMRLVLLRGFIDIDAYSLDTFSGSAKRTSHRIFG